MPNNSTIGNFGHLVTETLGGMSSCDTGREGLMWGGGGGGGVCDFLLV